MWWARMFNHRSVEQTHKIRLCIVLYHLDVASAKKKIKSFIDRHHKLEISFYDLKSTPKNNYLDALDFSGYHFLSDINLDSDSEVFIFLNDTIFLKHPYKYILNFIFKNTHLLLHKSRSVSMGIVHPYNEVLVDMNFVHHVQTFVLAMNKNALIIFNQTLEELNNQLNCNSVNGYLSTQKPYLQFIVNSHLKLPQNFNSWVGIRNNDDILLRKERSLLAEFKVSESLTATENIFINIPRNKQYYLELIIVKIFKFGFKK